MSQIWDDLHEYKKSNTFFREKINQKSDPSEVALTRFFNSMINVSGGPNSDVSVFELNESTWRSLEPHEKLIDSDKFIFDKITTNQANFCKYIDFLVLKAVPSKIVSSVLMLHEPQNSIDTTLVFDTNSLSPSSEDFRPLKIKEVLSYLFRFI
jgi:hypothetical protein